MHLKTHYDKAYNSKQHGIRSLSKARLAVTRAVTNSAGAAAQHRFSQASIAASEASAGCPFTALKTQLGFTTTAEPSTAASYADVPGPKAFRFVTTPQAVIRRYGGSIMLWSRALANVRVDTCRNLICDPSLNPEALPTVLWFFAVL